MSSKKRKNHYHGHRARLRTRVLRYLSDVEEYELLEILLTFVQPRKDVKIQAKDIIDSAGSIRAMLEQHPNSYKHIHGVGENISRYCALLAEVAIRYARVTTNDTVETNMTHNTHDPDNNYQKHLPLYSFVEVQIYLQNSNIYEYHTADFIIYVNHNREVLYMEEYNFTEHNTAFISHLISVKPAGVVLVRKIAQEKYTLNKQDVELLKKREKALSLFDIQLFDYIVCTPQYMISLQQYSLLSR